MKDRELWLALHDECPPYADCCKLVNMEVDDETNRLLGQVLAYRGYPSDVFHRSVVVMEALDQHLG